MDCKLAREIPKSFCSDDETIGLVQELYGTKVNKGICCVFRYNNLTAKNVLPEYVCDYKKRAGLFQRSADLEQFFFSERKIKNRFWFFWRVIIAFGKHPEKPLPQGVGKVLYQRGL